MSISLLIFSIWWDIIVILFFNSFPLILIFSFSSWNIFLKVDAKSSLSSKSMTWDRSYHYPAQTLRWLSITFGMKSRLLRWPIRPLHGLAFIDLHDLTSYHSPLSSLYSGYVVLHLCQIAAASGPLHLHYLWLECSSPRPSQSSLLFIQVLAQCDLLRLVFRGHLI